jgi:hypothetical protein
MVATVLGWIVDGAIVALGLAVWAFIAWRVYVFIHNLFWLASDEVEKRKGK